MSETIRAKDVHRSGSPGDGLRHLSSLRLDGQDVLSLYLDFDLSRFPTLSERRTQADALLSSVDRHDPIDPSAPHSTRMARREDLEQVRAALSDAELTLQGAHGLAVFCCAPAGVLALVSLPRGVEGLAVVQHGPFIEPLVEMLAPERWAVLLISRRDARILRGTRDRLTEIGHVLDDVHGRHSQGGWSQSRYQRGIEHEVDEHIGGACEALLQRFRSAGFDRLLIGCHAELRGRVEEHLQPDLISRLAGHFEVDVERASVNEVLEIVTPLIEDDERGREREALERLAEGLAHGQHAAAGIDEVLELLGEGRVQVLMVAEGYTDAGFACPACGRLTTIEGACPADGNALVPCKDLIESAVELALDRSARVMVVRHELQAFAQHGPVAALLRY